MRRRLHRANGPCVAAPAANENKPSLPPLAESQGLPEAPSCHCLRSIEGAYSVGNYGKNDENQDVYLMEPSRGGSKSFVAVFDGHGENGKQIADLACAQISSSFFGNRFTHLNPALALESSFAAASRQIEHSTTLDASVSGTTAVVAYRRRNHLVVAHLGDSRAVLGRRSEEDPDAPPGLRAEDLTWDHRPSRPDERRRVLSEGAVVHPSYERVDSGNGAPARLLPVGPQRVWDKTGRHGLCVTRSLGDLLMRPFLSAEPELMQRMLDPDDRLLVLGSDGVWDCLSSQEAVDIAAQYTNPHMAARKIAEEAEMRWQAKTNGCLCDDITVLVMYLEFGPPPAVTELAPSPSEEVIVHRPRSARPSFNGKPCTSHRALLARLPMPASARRAPRELVQSPSPEPMSTTGPAFYASAGGPATAV